MKKDNYIDQLKANIRSQQAEIKLAKLENEAVLKQTRFEKNLNKQL